MISFEFVAFFYQEYIPYFREYFPPFNSFSNNYSIYEVKNCQNAETILKFPHFPISKKNSFCGNYSRKYGIYVKLFIIVTK